ncbi:TetR/AcrR family transcriptional regulator [Effusibacillus dendaii]|uniref:TetR family transcriptional regulator n=1 Tax=Effusibacillus dendaii TaxID=2743772 RepID=A0A7I8D8A3_9BACL|nr:TetR/AcrR family transcriptional regulator [Effusibacillus dendaii]BCJ86247.1 TetR family transcriptional regulator [Effusibacillus dendaii]
MSHLTPRQIKAQQTKKRILETALDLFSKKGFDHVTVDEIVNKSKTSKGAFYVHFKSKYEIFLEKFKEIDDFYATFIRSLPAGTSSHEKILRLTESQMIYLRDCLGKDLIRTVYMSALIPNPANYFSNTDRELYKIVHSFVKEGQEAGEIKKELSSSEITMLITRCMRGTLYDWCLFEESFDLLAESQKFIRVVLAGIKA